MTKDMLKVLMASRRSGKSYYTSKLYQDYLSRIGRLNTKFNGYKLDIISFDE